MSLGIGVPEFTIILTILAGYAALVVIPAARICSRAGFSGWLGLLAMVPVLNVLLLWFVAFAEWPACPGARPPATER